MRSLPTNRTLETNPDQRLPLVVILGPTAVGKTAISIQLAERIGAEIVSADSRLFYRGMDIGTAKPTASERKRVPHHLVDVAEPDQIWSLALFQQRAFEAISGIFERGRLPLLVGGSGQYIRAITQGWHVPEVEPDPRLRKALTEWVLEIGDIELHRRLAVLDQPAASSIDPRNLRRTVRALEVILSSGRRFSTMRRSTGSRYRLLQIGLSRPRPELYARIDARIDAMIAAGFVEEVRTLLDLGFSPELPSLSAIGYREIIAYLQGEIDLDQAVLQIRRSSRVFVRRQANWYKLEDPDINWFQVGENVVSDIQVAVLDFISGYEYESPE